MSRRSHVIGEIGIVLMAALAGLLAGVQNWQGAFWCAALCALFSRGQYWTERKAWKESSQAKPTPPLAQRGGR
jgi:MFS family permease